MIEAKRPRDSGKEQPLRRVITVADIDDGRWYGVFHHCVDTPDVEWIEESLTHDKRGVYDSYFVAALDGELLLVYGMHGQVAYIDKTLTKVYGSVTRTNLLRKIGKI